MRQVINRIDLVFLIQHIAAPEREPECAAADGQIGQAQAQVQKFIGWQADRLSDAGATIALIPQIP